MIIAQKHDIRLKFEFRGEVKITLIKPLDGDLDSYIESLKWESEWFLKKQTQTYVPYPILGFQIWLSENGWEIIKRYKVPDIDYPDDVVF